MKKILDWFDSRTGYKHLLHEALFESVPGGARWRYVWGSTLIFTFSVQVITGLFLWTAYSPSAQTAWESVYFINDVMFMGSIVRGIHHYAAQAMIVLMAIHLMQVVVDGAYRAPREINFWLGLVLLQIVLGLSLTGYLLPWDQKGYYATQVSTKIMGAAPVVGQQLQELAQGGKEYGHHTLTRFFAMHAGILPALLMGFLGLHIYVFRRHGITVCEKRRGEDTTFWPDQVLKDAVACLGVLAVVMALAIFRGAELSAPADSSQSYSAARPEWYFLFLFRFLRFESVEHFGLAFGAIYLPGLIMTVIALMPIIGWWKLGHKFNVTFMWLLAIGIIGLTGLAVYEDANDPGHQAALAEADRDGHRIRELASREEMIPVAGAVTLLRSDPFTQGPRIFAARCAGCHRIDGHDGRGRIVVDMIEVDGQNTTRETEPTAADLGNFASREWMRAVVTDFSNHFAAIRNSTAFIDGRKSEDIEFFDPDESEMADWSGNAASLMSAENDNNLNALIEFLVQQANHGNETVDEDLAAKGRSVAVDGTWAGELAPDGDDGINCASCHSHIGEKFSVTLEETGYPTIAEYGSANWLKDFIANPGSSRHYGEKNSMPAFKSRMTERELDLLVRWMTHDYHPTQIK
jgi:ubiquinol-cytochrome c reductase cytochrome b subunit